MTKEKMKNLLFIIIILLPVAGGTGAYCAFSKLIENEPRQQPEPTTRFYVINEAETISGASAFYRVILENHEGYDLDYKVKVRIGSKEIYNEEIKLNNNNIYNKTVSFIPAETDNYVKHEFLLFRDNQPYRTRVFQIPSVNNNASVEHLDVSRISTQEVDIEKNVDNQSTNIYNKEKIGETIIYTFNTGEKLKLKLSDGKMVGIGDAVYSTAIKGNEIIFIGETYEKTIVNTARYINPVIIDLKNITLKSGDTLKLKDGYAVTLNQIDENSLKLAVSKNNKILRDIISQNNSQIEYWQKIDEYKKKKILQITPRKMDSSELVLDLIQYGGDKLVIIGNKYGEFQVTNITEDSIILKNTREIPIKPGQELSLINNTIKIII